MLTVHAGPWEALQAPLMVVRTAVFIEEQQVPVELEWDDDDATACHLLALEGQGNAIGCARLLPTGQIGRMAVLTTHRGQGVGAALLLAAETKAREQSIGQVFLHAQTHAIPFYLRFGYAVCSDVFMDAGIPHCSMHKVL